MPARNCPSERNHIALLCLLHKDNDKIARYYDTIPRIGIRQVDISCTWMIRMHDRETEFFIELQQHIHERLMQIGFAPGSRAANLERNLAQFVALSRTFSESTLPLFLSMELDHQQTFVDLVGGMNATLEELRDTLTDIDPDLLALNEHLRAKL